DELHPASRRAASPGLKAGPTYDDVSCARLAWRSMGHRAMDAWDSGRAVLFALRDTCDPRSSANHASSGQADRSAPATRTGRARVSAPDEAFQPDQRVPGASLTP